MKSTVCSLFVALFVVHLVTACDSSTGVETNNEIRYVVEDFSEEPVLKVISYTHGSSGEEVVVYDNTSSWETTTIFEEHKRDANISARIDTAGFIHMAIYIYKNGEIVESDEALEASGLSIRHIN